MKSGNHNNNTLYLPDSRLAEESVVQILSNVNIPDIIKYVPDGFLNDEKKKIKYEAIANTAIYTNKKNNNKYKSFVESGKMSSALLMLKAAAKEKEAEQAIQGLLRCVNSR